MDILRVFLTKTVQLVIKLGMYSFCQGATHLLVSKFNQYLSIVKSTFS